MAVEKIIIEAASNGFIASNGKGVKIIGNDIDELSKLIAEQTAKAVKNTMFGNNPVALTISVETIITPQNNKEK